MTKQQRLIRALGLLLLTVLVGTVGFKWLLGVKVDILDALYMTVITISGVGFDDVVNLSEYPYAQLFTIGLIVVGGAECLIYYTVYYFNYCGWQCQNHLKKTEGKNGC